MTYPLRCKVCDAWLHTFSGHLRGTGRGDLLCVPCIAWFAGHIGQDPKRILSDMGIVEQIGEG